MAQEPTVGGLGVEAPPPIGSPVAGPPRTRRPRIWILVAGGWEALCWLLLILSAVTVDIAGVLLAIVAMLPVSLLWRFRYWRLKKTPFYGATTTVDDTPIYTREHNTTEWDEEGNAYLVRGVETFEGPKRTRESADFGKRGLGSLIAGFFFPMRDAVAEWRGSRGRGPGALI